MILTLTLFLCMLIGMPVFVAIGFSCIASMWDSPLPMTFIPQNLYTGMDQFPLIAIIGFVLAGFLMEPAGITDKIVDVAKKIIGSLTGGLAIVTILSCMIFSSLSGSGPATTAAIGSLMIPGMIMAGYSKNFAAGVTSTGGTLGILIPPSNPLIIYGVVANASITGLFLAGVIPGMMLTTLYIIAAYLIARRNGFKGTEEAFSGKELLLSIWRGKWALLMPVIILGGIYGGIFTPTEAAEVGAVYAIFVGFVITRTLTVKGLIDALIRTSAMAGTVTVLVGISMTFSRLITLYRIPQAVGDFLFSISSNPTVILLIIAAILFLAGFIADTIAMIVVLTPIFLPVTAKLGIHPIHLGILFVVCCEAGFLTPPFGANLFVSMKLIDVRLEELAVAVLPFIAVIILVVLAVAVFPQISLILPQLVLGH